MDAAEFQRVEALFHRLSPLVPEDRGEILDLECADAPEVRRRVEALLAADSTDFAPQGVAPEALVEQGLGWVAEGSRPERVGPYRIVEELGRGGFSTVYLAERDDGHYSMRVAIKLVHHHLRRDDVLRRLRRERQILARLDHPNIARLLDGGSTEEGVPYVVMEAIEGVPIDRFCCDQGLDLRRRLALFHQVCGAVDYAHRNLVLHRDVKPSNILVTGDGVPKLLDFGIAKLLEGGDTSAGLPGTDPDLAHTLTLDGSRVLTPEYASPEQILGRPLTTASDVYSLGVVLYRLVAERPPYALDGERWSEVERLVCEVEPEPPSRRSGARRSALVDLDAIVLQALVKDPDRRYATVGRLADDLGHFLAGRPVTARRSTVGERLVKLVRRHRRWVATAAVLAVVLATTLTAVLWQSAETRRAQRRAELERTEAEGVAEFVEVLFDGTDPFVAGGSVTTREVVARASARIRQGFGDDSERATELFATLGRVYSNLGLYDEGEQILRWAVDGRRARSGAGDPGLAPLLRDLGTVHADRGACAAARATLRWARSLEERAAGAPLERAATLHRLGQVEMNCGATESARSLLGEALALRRQQLGPTAEAALDSESLLGELEFSQGRYDRAEAIFERVLEHRRRLLDPGHPHIALSLSDLASVHVANGRPAEALPLYQEALDGLRQRVGGDHGLVASELYHLAVTHAALGEVDAARDRFHEALGVAEARVGGEHPIAARCLHQLGILELRVGHRELGEKHLRRALDLRRRLLDPADPQVAQTYFTLARAVAEDDPQRGLELYAQVLELQESTFPKDDYRLSYPLLKMGEIHRLDAHPDLAEPLFRRALGLRQRGLPPGHWETALAEAYLGQALLDLGRLDEARELLEASHRHLEAALGAEDRRTIAAARRLAALPES